MSTASTACQQLVKHVTVLRPLESKDSTSFDRVRLHTLVAEGLVH
jgi:hypothetical protein